jgi:hypothetical protein
MGCGTTTRRKYGRLDRIKRIEAIDTLTQSGQGRTPNLLWRAEFVWEGAHLGTRLEVVLLHPGAWQYGAGGRR